MCLEHAKVNPDIFIVWLSKVYGSGPYLQGTLNRVLPIAQP